MHCLFSLGIIAILLIMGFFCIGAIIKGMQSQEINLFTGLIECILITITTMYSMHCVVQCEIREKK